MQKDTLKAVNIYTLNKSSKWYTVYICRVLQKGLIAIYLECIVLFRVHIKGKQFHLYSFYVQLSISVYQKNYGVSSKMAS